MRRALTALLVCGALLFPGNSVAAEAAPGPVVKGFSYGRHPRQTMTVYGTKGPALVILHGGFWASDTDWSDWALWFSQQGFTVYDTDYRLNSDAHWDAQRADARAALHWVAARHDGERPLLLGSSAGGQIATVAGAYGAGGTRVRGVVGLSPAATPYRAWVDGARDGAGRDRRRLRREARRLAGCDPGRAGRLCWERWADMAARTHASGAEDPPMFLVHSAHDFVPAAHSRDLAVAQRVAGARNTEVRVVPGAAHGAKLLDDPTVRDTVLRWLRDRV